MIGLSQAVADKMQEMELDLCSHVDDMLVDTSCGGWPKHMELDVVQTAPYAAHQEPWSEYEHWFDLKKLDCTDVDAVLGRGQILEISAAVRQQYRSRADKSATHKALCSAFSVCSSTHSLERVFCKLVYITVRVRRDVPPEDLLDFVEYFAGRGGISRCMAERGLNVFAFDFLTSSRYDVLSPEGFRLHVIAACFTAATANTWSGIECSSWVWVCRAITKRTRRRPLGSRRVAAVRNGNAHLIRQSVLTLLVHLNGNGQVIEQPQSSLMNAVPLFCRMQRQARLLQTQLAAYR